MAVTTTLGGVKWSFSAEGKRVLGMKSNKRRAAEQREREEEAGEMKGKRKAMVLTEEKAKLLRRQLRETEIGSDGMYRSAIASLLAFSYDENEPNSG